MTQPLLSILIPTVVGREKQFYYLIEKIMSFNGSRLIHLASYKDDKEITIGEKREKLYQLAEGLFSWQIDDDDSISDNAIELILQVIKSNPDVDCITFEERIDMDGKIMKSNHSLTYNGWQGEGDRELDDGFHFHRTPYFKDVIKTSIAQSVQIPHIRWSEDFEWSMKLKDVLQTEYHISQEIYLYQKISTPDIERYGLDKN